MPIGSYANLYYIADELQRHKPQSVLDLGVGFGMNGVLVRQYVDLGLLSARGKQCLLIGVEVFGSYKNATWDIYDHIHTQTIEQYLLSYGGDFDCILMTDVIEHFLLAEGLKVLTELTDLLNPGGIILVCTPGVFVAQGAVYGNEHERHLSHWKQEDFPAGFKVIKPATPDQYGHQNLIMKYVKS